MTAETIGVHCTRESADSHADAVLGGTQADVEKRVEAIHKAGVAGHIQPIP